MKQLILGNYEPDVAAVLAALREPRRVPQGAEVERRIDGGPALLELRNSVTTSRVMMRTRDAFSLIQRARKFLDYTTSERILNFAQGRYQKVVAAS